MWAFIITGFVSGLIGSLHCVGMCGPISFAIPKPKNNPTKQMLSIMSYHFGRITTYVLLGLIFGFIGHLINLFVVQQWISIVTGSLILLIVVLKIINIKTPISNRLYLKLNSKLQGILKQLFSSSHPGRTFGIGMVNGLLPCTMSFLAIIGSMGMGSISSSIFFMIAFGIGTMPLLLIFNLFTEQFKKFKKGSYQQIMLGLGLFIGIVFIFRGLDLGIDYLSPKMNYENGLIQDCSHLPTE